MPILYTEEKVKRKSIYTKNIVSQDGEIVSSRQVKYPLHQSEKDGLIYFCLYDDNMVLIRDFFEYVNFSLGASPLTTRRQTAFALRLLYCFLSLSGYNINKLDKTAVNELINFLRGMNTNPDYFKIVTQRSASTVNGYLSVYRSFFTDTGDHTPESATAAC